MALTLESEQRLARVNLIGVFKGSPARWKGLAKQAYNFVKKNFPAGGPVRPDDVAKVLIPLLEVEATLINYLSANKLKQRYWIRDFCDLILDREWDQISA